MHAPMVVALSEAPTSFERVLEDRKAQISRATNADAELIACPGGCGGAASIESPMSVTRDGVTRTVRVAQCLGECRRETRSPRSGKTRLVAARFDVPYPETPETPETEGQVDSDPLVPPAEVSPEPKGKGVDAVRGGNPQAILEPAAKPFQEAAPEPTAPPSSVEPAESAPPRQNVVDTVVSAEPQPVVEPATEQLPEPDPEPSVDPSGPPLAEPTSQPLAQHRAEPLAQAALEDGGLSGQLFEADDVNQASPIGSPAEPDSQPEVLASDPDSPPVAPGPPTEPAPEGEEFPVLLRRALKAQGITQSEAGALFGCSQSGVSKMLNGLPVAQSTMLAARAWVQSLNREGPASRVVSSSLGPDGVSRSGTNGSSNGAKNGAKEHGKAALEGELPATTSATGDRAVPLKPAKKDHLPAVEDLAAAEANPPVEEAISSPYEAVLRTVLQQVAQRHLEEIAGPAAKGVVVRVTLEWGDGAPS